MHGNMPITPAELGIPQSEVDQSQDWWRAMSLNDWKGLEAKHNWPSYGRWSRIHYLWTLEGKPCTQP